MKNIRNNLDQLVIELALLKRNLLLMQIENLEDELLPCEEPLAGCLAALNQGKEIPDRLVIKKAAAASAQLHRLHHELSSTEHLLAVVSR